MSDAISREAALEAVTKTAVQWGVTGEPAILIATKQTIRALPAVTPGVKVKPLVWEDFEGRGAKAQAWRKANYLIIYWKSRGEYEVVESYPGYQGDAIGDGFYPTIEAAKAAAQADYEARILAALDLTPQPAPDVAGLVEALRFYASESLWDYDGMPDSMTPMERDGGQVARAALAAMEGIASLERELVEKIMAELVRARTKFPGKNVTFAALVEEVGELATATFEESAERVEKEAVQVAVMAMRMVLDGDHCFNEWRKEKGLDPLDPTARAALAAMEGKP